MVAIRVVVAGRVQGVGFRAWAEREARSLGLSGWVRNLADGSVEAVFAGPAERVEDMVERCRRGPPRASVEVLERHEDAEPPRWPGFQIRPMAR